MNEKTAGETETMEESKDRPLGQETPLETIRAIYQQREPGFINQKKFFAVLIPLLEVAGELHLLFETRARDMEDQPGEICFPGGAVEEGETPRQAALRECEEEIGIATEQIEILGAEDLLIHTPSFVLHPFVGVLHGVSLTDINQETEEGGRSEEHSPKDFPRRWQGLNPRQLTGLTLSPREVEDVFTIPLAYFLEREPREEWIGWREEVPADFPYELIGQDASYRWDRSRYSVLIYDYPGRYLWGITAKLAHHLAQRMGEGKSPTGLPKGTER